MIDLPAPGEYWRDPKRATIGDTDPDTIFVEVGKAISTWEIIEFYFSEVFGLFVGGKAIGPIQATAKAAYGSISTNRGRREAIVEAAKVFFASHLDESPSAKADFDVLVKHFESSSRIRNNIAHGAVVGYKVNERDCGHFLQPPKYSRHTDSMKYVIHEGTGTPHPAVKYRYVSGDILAFRQKFDRLQASVRDFYIALYQRLNPFNAKSHE